MSARLLRNLGIAALALFLALVGCQKSQEAKPAPEGPAQTVPAAEPQPEEPVEVPAVNLFEMTFWDQPGEGRKALGTLRRGETVVWLNETARGTDTGGNERDYYKIRDAEGTVGWALADRLVPNARAAVVVEKTAVYERKSLITKTEQTYQPMDILAVISEENDWVQVAHTGRDQTQWIKPGTLTYAELDLAVAALANKALAEKDEQQRKVKLEALHDELKNDRVLGGSRFVESIDKFLAPEREPIYVEVRELAGEAKGP